MKVGNDRLTITLRSSAIAEALGHRLPTTGKTCEIDIKVRLTRTGLAVKLVSSNGRASTTPIDNQVVGLLRQASEWWHLLNEDGITIAELARCEDVNDSYVTRIIRLNFLAPDIVQSMLDGSQPAMLNAQRLKAGDFPTSWKGSANSTVSWRNSRQRSPQSRTPEIAKREISQNRRIAGQCRLL